MLKLFQKYPTVVILVLTDILSGVHENLSKKFIYWLEDVSYILITVSYFFSTLKTILFDRGCAGSTLE